jgi:hypothetical protein
MQCIQADGWHFASHDFLGVYAMYYAECAGQQVECSSREELVRVLHKMSREKNTIAKGFTGHRHDITVFPPKQKEQVAPECSGVTPNRTHGAINYCQKPRTAYMPSANQVTTGKDEPAQMKRTQANLNSIKQLDAIREWLINNPQEEIYLGPVQVCTSRKEEFGRVMRAFGAFTKQYIGDSIYLYHRLPDGSRLYCASNRDLVCTRVQTGTKTITHPAQPAMAAQPERIEEVPIYEWDCGSVLKETKE